MKKRLYNKSIDAYWNFDECWWVEKDNATIFDDEKDIDKLMEMESLNPDEVWKEVK